MLVVFLTNDLVFPSRVAGVAQRLGARMETAGTGEALLEKVGAVARGTIHPHPRPLLTTASLRPEGEGDAEPTVVIIDLNSSAAATDTLISKLNALAHPPRSIVAFGPHVHEERLAAARSAGCDIVLTRGQFDAQMNELLEKLLLGERE